MRSSGLHVVFLIFYFCSPHLLKTLMNHFWAWQMKGLEWKCSSFLCIHRIKQIVCVWPGRKMIQVTGEGLVIWRSTRWKWCRSLSRIAQTSVETPRDYPFPGKGWRQLGWTWQGKSVLSTRCSVAQQLLWGLQKDLSDFPNAQISALLGGKGSTTQKIIVLIRL